MKDVSKFILCISILSIVLYSCSSTVENDQNTSSSEPEVIGSEEVSWLYVLRAESGSTQGDRIVFNNADDKLVYFSDRPERLAGTLPLPTLPTLWTRGKESFQKTPPNAALALYENGISHEGEHEEPETVIITLTDVDVSDDEVSFKYAVIQGTIPNDFGECSIFIDRRQQGGNSCETCPSSFGCQ